MPFKNIWKKISRNKHTESIAEAIQVPHRPQQIKICKHYFSALVSKDEGKKCGKLCISYILSPKRRITRTKINTNKRYSNLVCSIVKESHKQNFKMSKCFKMSKDVRENCGKLLISYILSTKRSITPRKIDGNQQHLNLICSTVKESHMQNFS